MIERNKLSTVLLAKQQQRLKICTLHLIIVEFSPYSYSLYTVQFKSDNNEIKDRIFLPIHTYPIAVAMN